MGGGKKDSSSIFWQRIDLQPFLTWRWSHARNALNKRKQESAITAAFCIEAAKDCVLCCKGLGTAKYSSKTQRQVEDEALQKYFKFITTAFGVLCSTKNTTTVAF